MKRGLTVLILGVLAGRPAALPVNQSFRTAADRATVVLSATRQLHTGNAGEFDGTDTLKNDDGQLKLYYRAGHTWVARLSPASPCTLKNIITYKYASDTLGRVAGCSLFVYTDSSASGHALPGHVVYQSYARDSIWSPYNVLISSYPVGGNLVLGPGDFWVGFRSIPLATSTPPYKDTLFALSDSYPSGAWRDAYSADGTAWYEVARDFLVRAVVGYAASLSQDAGVVAITAPTGTITINVNITPTVRIANTGSSPMSFNAWFTMAMNSPDSVVYRVSTPVSNLAVGEQRTVSFPTWFAPHLAGSYTARCSLAVNDSNPANNVLADSFVLTDPLVGWTSLRPMPDLPSAKQIKEGGWLAADNGAMYAAKGNKTPDFYVYYTAASYWKTLAPIPAGDRAPGKGSAGASDGNGMVYVTRGNNTQDFLVYNATTDSWRRLAVVPLGRTNKRVKGGTDMVYVPPSGDSGQGGVYLLKGYKNEFWRYDPATDVWTPLADAPIGPSGKENYDKGSFLVYDGAGTIYAHKAKRNELFAFHISSSGWRTDALPGIPFTEKTGRFTRSKDGGSGAWYEGALYALKGGNTFEFWRFAPGADSWKQLEDIPPIGSSARKKKVKGGASIASDPSVGALFATKGNKVNELWRYQPDAYAGTPNSGHRASAVAGVARDASSVMRIFPNPVRSGFATVMLSGPVVEWSRGPVTVSVYDAIGRAVLQSAISNLQSAIALDLRGLRAGVYVVRLSARGFAAQQRFLLRD